MSIRAFLIVAMAFAAVDASAADHCMRVTHALSAGAVPSAGDFITADCKGQVVSAVRYDRAMGAVRLAHDLQPGDVVAEIPPSMMAGIGPGEKLYVTVRVGPVLVQREVEALQPANPGQKLFVRAADGQVISVLYAGDGK